MPIDNYRIYLDSFNYTSGTNSKPYYNIKFPSKRINYTGYKLYVDDFCISLSGLSTNSVQVRTNLSQYNSYNSRVGGSNDIIATLFNPNVDSDRTTDLTLKYQAPLTPYHINSFPENLNIHLTDVEGEEIVIDNDDAFWILNLRLEGEYE